MIRILRSLAVSLLLFASLCAAADPGRVPLSSMQLNGDATLLTDGYIRLTRNFDMASSAFVPTPFALGPNDGFVVAFVYTSQQELDQCIADGLAFVAQNTTAGPGYLGTDGSGLGFFTETDVPAIGVTFDYYANAITGTPANAVAIATPNGHDLKWTTPDPPALSGPDAARYVWVAYQNPTQVMRVYYSSSPTPPSSPLLEMVLPQDLSTVFGGQVYFGITAGTGSCYTQQFLRFMEINVGPVN
jgi:hypothetical protein